MGVQGVILVAGGLGLPTDPAHPAALPVLAGAQIYDPLLGIWTATGDLHVPRFEHSSTLLSTAPCGLNCDEALVTGGAISFARGGSSVFTPSTEMFDPDGDAGRGAWATIDSLRVARSAQTATLLASGKVLVTGSGTRIDVAGATATSVAEVFDPTVGSGKWSYAQFTKTRREVDVAVQLQSPSCRAPNPPAYCGDVLIVGDPLNSAFINALPGELYAPGPEVAAVTPATGPSSGGASITISGSGFTSDTTVTIGDVAAQVVGVDSDHQLRAVVPAHQSGSVPVVVTDSGVSSATLRPAPAFRRFTYEVSRTPQAVTDLVARATSAHQVALEFSSVASDGPFGPGAPRYVVKQSSSPIATQEDFDRARTVCCGDGGIASDVVGDKLALVVDDLEAATTYHYAVEAVNSAGMQGPLSNQAPVTTLDNGVAPSPCAPSGPVGPAQVLLGGGRYQMVGGPTGTVFGATSPLYGWLDIGAGGTYSVRPGDQAAEAGRGYWAWSRCDHLVTLAGSPTPTSPLSLPLGAYHASMVGNPSATGPASVSGHDFAATWDPGANGGAGGYAMSGFRQPQSLDVGQGAWLFAYSATEIRILPPN